MKNRVKKLSAFLFSLTIVSSMAAGNVNAVAKLLGYDSDGNEIWGGIYDTLQGFDEDGNPVIETVHPEDYNSELPVQTEVPAISPIKQELDNMDENEVVSCYVKIKPGTNYLYYDEKEHYTAFIYGSNLNISDDTVLVWEKVAVIKSWLSEEWCVSAELWSQEKGIEYNIERAEKCLELADDDALISMYFEISESSDKKFSDIIDLSSDEVVDKSEKKINVITAKQNSNSYIEFYKKNAEDIRYIDFKVSPNSNSVSYKKSIINNARYMSEKLPADVMMIVQMQLESECDIQSLFELDESECSTFLDIGLISVKNEKINNIIDIYENESSGLVKTFEISVLLADQSQSGEEIAGDINSDGKADLTDLTELSLALIGDNELTATQQKAADVDRDGEVKLADLAMFKQFLSKQISSLG